MGVIMEMTKAFLDSKGVKYSNVRENLITITYSCDNIDTVKTYVLFDDNDRTVGIKAFDICKIPKDKVDSLYKICSELNEQYRWVKFYVEERDNTITAEDDAVVQADTAGDEIFELVRRLIRIVDEVYPELMKALWS